jgi:hypothetical protein
MEFLWANIQIISDAIIFFNNHETGFDLFGFLYNFYKEFVLYNLLGSTL